MTRPHETAQLFRTLVLSLVILAVLVWATSCAPVPRAIIPPASVVRELEIQPVSDAGSRTRDAVREIAAERTAWRAIVDTFQTSLGRANP